MKTYTTKIAKNGATLYYSTETGKRIAKETALETERNYILANGTVKERYELAKEEFYLTNYGTMMKNGFYTAISTGTSKAFKLATKCDWHEVSDKSANFDLERYYHMTVEEFRAEAEAETEENAEVEETTTEQVAEVETEAQEVSKNFDADIRYEFNGGAGMDTSPNFATATEAAQWIIDFAANHPEYTFTGGRVHDNGNCKRYPFTDADIIALNANKAAQEVSTEKVDIKEIIAEGLKQVDFSNVTKFEVGKTYYGATWEGKFNPNVAVIVKKLTVTKITPKTICTVDENGRARRSKFTEAYAGTTEGFTIGTPNGYVDIYAFNEYTPAVAAVPTDNYTVWSEAALAIREGKTPEVNMVEEKTEVSEYKPQTSWENPHTYETEGCLDTERYLAARNHFTTVEELLPELGELKTEIDATNDKYLLAGIGLLICSHFDLNEARKVFGPILSEYRAEAEATVDDVKKLYNVCARINFDKTFEHMPEFEYVRDGIKEETLDKAHDIFRAIRYNLGDQALASELTKLADEFGIDRALLLQSSDCRFNPALFDERPELPELTGRMKWAAELLDNYTYEFEGDWEAGNGGLARHYKRFNRDGEQCGKVVEVFTDKTNFILDHVNIVGKKIRTYYYINGEQLSYLDGEFNFLWSNKYNAGMSMVGGEHLQVEVPDGRRKKFPNFAVDDDEFFQIMSERGACTIGEPEPPEIPATVETNLPDKYQAALEGVYVEDEVGDFVPAAGMTNVATDNLMVYRKGDGGFMEEDPDKYVELLNMEEELEDVMLDKKITEENHKLDEAFAKHEPPENPATVEPVEPPAESFTAKRDRLIAERDAANAKLKEAEEALKAAKLAAYNAKEKFFDFMADNMHKLNEQINLPDAEMEVKTTDGCLAYIALETVRVTFKDTKFILCGDCSVIYGMTLGTYDTPEQVMTAVEKFKAAIERGDKRFDFANLDQNFDKHSLRDSLKRAMKIAWSKADNFAQIGQVTDADVEHQIYVICRDALAALN